ncbi:MAG: sugar phosphate isomerase/epimerase family protein [Limisphaerales bacterium]
MIRIKHIALLTFAAALLLSETTGFAAKKKWRPKLGLQSWTCRNMTFDQVVKFAKSHKLKYLQLIGKHIDPKGDKAENLRKKKVLEDNGLVCYTFGVQRTYDTKEENRQTFEFAKYMGIKLIVVEPRKLEQWDNLEELVKEYDIKLAIHNHGHSSSYGTPEKVWNVIGKRDKRIGVCVDIGHISGAGFDVAKAFVDYKGRVYDFHVKDKQVEKAKNGKDIILDVEIGKGVANYKGLFKELAKVNYQGVMAIETDNRTFAQNPTEFVKEAIQFVKKSTK